MAKSRTDTSRYPSRYSADLDDQGFAWVTGRQYIVEYICENKARKDSKELPRGFYTKGLNLPEWQSFYKGQINNRSLTKLIKNHGIDKIIAFLKENKWIISLKPKWVHDKLDEFVFVNREELKQEKIDYELKQGDKFSSNNSKNSIISRLEELE